MKIRPVKAWKGRIRFGRPSPRAEAAPRKKKRLKYIAILPSFITLVNGACGFIAIAFASRSPEFRWSLFRSFDISSFALSGYMILFAMIADVLDGRVARLTRTTSSFGGQLDSLSDAVSFGVAPAFLMMKTVEFHLESLRFGNLRFPLFISRGIFFSAIFYAMCAVVRLARFNVENDEDESAHMHFAGLPSPAAAGVVVSLVVFYEQFLSGIAGGHHAFETIAVIALPAVTLVMGILMVSRIRYPHLANQLRRSKKTLPVLLASFACGLFIIWNIQLALAIGFCGFAVAGVIRWIIVSLTRKRKAV